MRPKKESRVIRDARPGDRKAILRVTLSAYEEYAPFMRYWDYYREDIIATLERVGPAEQIVAELNGSLVGSVLLYPAGTVFTFPDGDSLTLKWPEVRLLAVAPAARGKGIGTSLMGDCIRRARRSGARFLTLHTNDIMAAAIRLYDRLGFQHDPGLDFPIDEHLTIKGYKLALDDKQGAGITPPPAA